MPPQSPRRSGRVRFGAEGRKLLVGGLLIFLVLFGQQLYGHATANARLDPGLRDVTGPVSVVVVLDFPPDRFHNERIAQYGVFAGRDGALNRLRLLNVNPEALAGLAALAWVARIEPLQQR